jgi:hypothetical protein
MNTTARLSLSAEPTTEPAELVARKRHRPAELVGASGLVRGTFSRSALDISGVSIRHQTQIPSQLTHLDTRPIILSSRSPLRVRNAPAEPR